MNILFQKTNAHWVKYSEYEYRRGEDDHLYLMPAPKAKPSVYDPMKDAEALVVDALNVGRLAMRQGGEKKLQQAVMEFVTKNGLLGFMTALPTTPDFIDYDAVYLPKNHFIKEETLSTQDYLSYFFPFHKPDIYKDKISAQWNINSGQDDFDMFRLAQTFSNEPMAMNMSLQRIYAERYDWLVTQFRDWAFMLVSSFLFYQDKDSADEFTRNLFRQGISAFGSKAPTYHISLYDDKPMIVWDFHSLHLTILTLFGFALTDETQPLRICKHCNMAFIAGHPNAAFCSPKCKNQFNVYKSRDKKKQDADQ